MKLLVVSDVHGKRDRLSAVMEMHRDADALIFLGDGLSDLFRVGVNDFDFTVFSVKGNCDAFFMGAENVGEELAVTLGGFKIFMLHGHTRGVKHGLDRAIYAAREKNADLLLFGHTHLALESYINDEEQKPLYLFNPGSLGYDGSFGLIEIRESNILFSHGKIK